jgi:hypothetical protein
LVSDGLKGSPSLSLLSRMAFLRRRAIFDGEFAEIDGAKW